MADRDEPAKGREERCEPAIERGHEYRTGRRERRRLPSLTPDELAGLPDKPSQAEGSRQTVEEDLRMKERGECGCTQCGCGEGTCNCGEGSCDCGAEGCGCGEEGCGCREAGHD